MIMTTVRSKLDGLGYALWDGSETASGGTSGGSYGDAPAGTFGDTVGETVENGGFFSNLLKGDIDMKWLLILAAIVVLILLILLLTDESRKKAALEKRFSEYDMLKTEVESRMRYCTEELVKVKHNKEKVAGMNPADARLKGAARFEEVRTELEHFRTDLRENEAKLASAKKNREDVKMALGIMTGLCRNMSGMSKRLEREISELREATLSDDKLLAELEKTHQAEDRIRNSDIRCSLSVSGISGLPGVTGMMSAKDFAGNYKTGSYRLDDIPLLGKPGFLGSPENLGSINLTVYGLPDRNGLLLRGSEKFTIKSGDGNAVRTDSAELLSGNVYELTVKTGKGSSRMELIVQ